MARTLEEILRVWEARRPGENIRSRFGGVRPAPVQPAVGPSAPRPPFQSLSGDNQVFPVDPILAKYKQDQLAGGFRPPSNMTNMSGVPMSGNPIAGMTPEIGREIGPSFYPDPSKSFPTAPSPGGAPPQSNMFGGTPQGSMFGSMFGDNLFGSPRKQSKGFGYGQSFEGGNSDIFGQAPSSRFKTY